MVAAASTVLGHLALHYREGDERPARRLLELLGCKLVDNGPAPGSDGFCTVLVDPATADYADNLMFLSGMTAEQEAVESAIRHALRLGEPDADPAAGAFEAASSVNPESSSHIGIRYRSLEALENVLDDLAAAASPGGELAGRIQVRRYRPRPGGNGEADADVAARIDASPAFSVVSRPRSPRTGSSVSSGPTCAASASWRSVAPSSSITSSSRSWNSHRYSAGAQRTPDGIR